MDTLILIGAAALVLAMLLNAGAPAPQPPRIIFVQTVNDPAPVPGSGCLGMIFAVIIFAALVALLGQFAG